MCLCVPRDLVYIGLGSHFYSEMPFLGSPNTKHCWHVIAAVMVCLFQRGEIICLKEGNSHLHLGAQDYESNHGSKRDPESIQGAGLGHIRPSMIDGGNEGPTQRRRLTGVSTFSET